MGRNRMIKFQLRQHDSSRIKRIRIYLAFWENDFKRDVSSDKLKQLCTLSTVLPKSQWVNEIDIISISFFSHLFIFIPFVN